VNDTLTFRGHRVGSAQVPDMYVYNQYMYSGAMATEMPVTEARERFSELVKVNGTPLVRLVVELVLAAGILEMVHGVLQKADGPPFH
jgi:hypothetical protein